MTISNNKLLIGASSGGSGPINVEDVFSVFLYEGNGGTQTINNGIDIAGEGGLVWIKNRDATDSHVLTDTVRGATKILHSDTTAAEATDDDTITAFNSTGFALGDDVKVNTNNESYCAWTFKKAPKFFDIQTYTGDGESTRTLSHNLTTDVGMVMVKGLNETESWTVYHRSLSAGGVIRLDTTGAEAGLGNGVAHVSGSTITLATAGNPSFSGNDSNVNYIAYIFAHNDGDGEFGSDGDADAIKCGSYTGAGTVNLGFEPQWVIFKRTESEGPWYLQDSMRGLAVDGCDQAFFYPDNNSADAVGTGDLITPTSTGFNHINAGEYVYVAIRRPNMATITDATEVFDVKQGVNSIPAFDTGFTADFALTAANISSTTAWRIRNRLTDAHYLLPNAVSAETSSTSSTYKFDLQTGYGQATNLTNTYGWIWKRAKGFCDVVAATSSGSGVNTTINHALSASPEMVWNKPRNKGDQYSIWSVYHKDIGPNKYLELNTTSAAISSNNAIFPTISSTQFEMVSGYMYASNPYIYYLFATLAGVSKVGSVTHSGSSTDVDCGFSAGARLVMLKRTDATGGWYWWDSVRGIIAGNDPYLLLDTTAAQVTNTDFIDPLASGFQISGNFTDGDYIFYAIA